MRPLTDILNNGKTRTAFSRLTFRHFKTSTDTETVFSFFSTARFGFDKPVLAITNLAHLPLPCRQATALAKSKKLNSPTHIIGLLRSLCAHLAPLNQKRKPAAARHIVKKTIQIFNIFL